MYKLAIVGIVLSGVLMSAAIAQAKPVGMSKAEHRALVIRSEGLNQKYGVGQKSQQAIIAALRHSAQMRVEGRDVAGRRLVDPSALAGAPTAIDAAAARCAGKMQAR